MVDRIDEMVEFPLPGLEQREQLVKLYFGLLLEGKEAAGGSHPITTKDIGDAEFKKVAELTEGYSGRAISKLMISLQGHVYGKEVTELGASRVFSAKFLEMRQRVRFDDALFFRVSPRHLIFNRAPPAAPLHLNFTYII